MQAPSATPALSWDIFCKVIDNFGDIGVCWRLASQLAARGQHVRLWADDASALAWMAPQGCPGVQVKHWSANPDDIQKALHNDTAGDVLIEAFCCEAAPEIIAAHAHKYWANHQNGLKTPIWINLEYLSAEPFVERSHGLPSPILHGPAQGLTKWFFYPGFTPGTGGLLREADVAQHPSHTELPTPQHDDSQRISLFCYEPPPLAQFLQQLAQGAQRTHMQVTHGRATQALHHALPHILNKNNQQANKIEREQLLISEQLKVELLPLMNQLAYDQLLQSCHFNCVRGEDSLVRALWAGKPFVWQIYPQDDGAHAAKLNAFLDWLQAPPSLRTFHHVWNGLSSAPLPALDLPAWGAAVQAARHKLLTQDDLVTQLMGFVQKKRVKS
jgi:uncharacterized repeat protein (TIGR03837 family)